MYGPLAFVQLFVDGMVEGIAHRPFQERERIGIVAGQRGVVRMRLSYAAC